MKSIPRLTVYLVAVVSSLGVGCDRLPGKPKESARYTPPEKVMDFAALFGLHCSGCHGADGKVGPAPPLNDALFLSIVPDFELRHVMEFGRHGTPMLGFSTEVGGPLTLQQIEVLVQGMRHNWGKKVDAKNLPVYRLADATLEGGPTPSKEAGAKVFAHACADCHGQNGDGKGGTAGPVNDPAFLALISDQALRRYIITGRPDLGMPDYASTTGRSAEFKAPLSEKDIADLVALLASWRISY